MKSRKLAIPFAIAVAAALGVAAISPTAVAKSKRVLFNIGTAGITGSFWATGGQVCNLVNKSRKKQKHTLRCTVESTGGSVSNLRALRAGDLDLIFAQSNLEYHSYNGSGPFKKAGPHKDLRFVMSFTTNRLHVVARKDAGIKKMADLKGKRVNTGNPGSGTETTAYMVFKYFGIDPKKDLALDSKLPSREQSKALCDGKIDAFLYPTAVPVATIEEAANTCDVNIVSLEGPELDKILADRDYFGRVKIPAGSYRGHDKDIVTFGYAAALLTTKDLPEEIGYHLTKAVMNGFEKIKKTAPMFSLMERKSSATFGKHVPYHPGAEKYYKESGLVK